MLCNIKKLCKFYFSHDCDIKQEEIVESNGIPRNFPCSQGMIFKCLFELSLGKIAIILRPEKTGNLGPETRVSNLDLLLGIAHNYAGA